MSEKQSQGTKRKQSKPTSNQQPKKPVSKTSKKSDTKTKKVTKTSTKIVVKSTSTKSDKTPKKSRSSMATKAKTKTATLAKTPKTANRKTADPVKPTKPTNKTNSSKTSKQSKTINEVKTKGVNPKTNKPSKTSKVATTVKKDLQAQKQNAKLSAKHDTTNVSDSKESVPIAKKTKQKSNFGPIFSKIVAGVISLSSLFFIITLYCLNVLPTHYFIIVFAFVLIIAGSCSFILWHKNTKVALKIPFNIIAITFSSFYLVGSGYILQVSGFLNDLKPQEYLSEQYFVIVKNDSKFQDITELDNRTVGTFDEGIEIYQDAITKLNDVVHTHLKTINSIRSMTDNLLSNDLDAVYLSAVHQSIIDEEDSKFSENTRIIYTIDVKVKIDTSEIHPNLNVTSSPFTIYISGNDAYGKLSDRGRSDVNMLVTVNPNTHKILLTSIPRDYYVQLHGTTGTRDKLTHAGMYGIQMSIDTIEDVFDINIDYYVKLNFSALEKIIDTIGGVDIYSEYEFVPWTNRAITIPAGTTRMNGAMALAFARERHHYEDGDIQRIKNQQAVLTAIFEKISHSPVLLTKYSDILSTVTNHLETNFSKNEISELIKLQLDEMPSWQITQYNVDGTGLLAATYSMGEEQLFVMEPDLATIQTAHDKITAILEGE